MGLCEGDMLDQETSAVLRVSRLPLVSSALQSVTSTYSGVKGRYPLLGLMGGVAEVGVRSISHLAMRRFTPLFQTLEQQIGVANSFALVGLDRLEKNFPILNQSTDEVVGHMKDAFFLTLDDVQLWLVDGMDGALNQLEHLSEIVRVALQNLQDTEMGQAATSGLDDLLSRLEDATAWYLPLPPTLRREWAMKVQEYEDEDDEDEPILWTRIRSLLLNISLQLYHRMMRVREQLQDAGRALADTAYGSGLGQAMELVDGLVRYLQSLLVALLYRAEALRQLTLNGVKDQAIMLADLRPILHLRELPVQIQQLLRDLQEISKLLLQLVINATPLYDMLQRPSDQDVQDFLNLEDFEGLSRRSSANNLFLKAMDGRPRHRRHLHARAGRVLNSPQSSDPPNGQRPSPSSLELESPPLPSESIAHRRPSAAELLLLPLKQLVSQSQKAFEYLSPNSADIGANDAPTAN